VAHDAMIVLVDARHAKESHASGGVMQRKWGKVVAWLVA